MSGIVIKVTGNICLIIDKDGVVHKVRLSGKATVGEFVSVPVRRVKPVFLSTIAAAVIMFVIGFSYIRPQMAYVPPDDSVEWAAEDDDSDIVIIEEEQLPLASPDDISTRETSEWVFPVCIAGAVIIIAGAVIFIVYRIKRAD